MDWNKIVALHNQGYDIESHSVNHCPLSFDDLETIEYQLSQSKQDLLKHGINAPLFVYPHGEGTEDVDIELVQQYYYAACNIKQGNLGISQPFNQYMHNSVAQ
jgi:peptidoglycan/xylan/chitin deacetylase (PgdA/CDA1 family)